MTLGIRDLIHLILAAAWRRRRLILAPIVLFSLLSVVAAFAWPRTYTARTLLMLQERQASDPLSSGGPVREGRVRVDEIDTLMKSDRVLTSAILDFNVGKPPLSAAELEGAVKSLRRQLSVSVVGSEFIEIELRQSDRLGIGNRLSVLLTRFFERLLSREDSMKTARQFALEQRRRDLDISRAAIEDWLKRAQLAGARVNPADSRVPELQAKFSALEQKLMVTASSLLSEPVTPATLSEAIADEIRLAQARPARQAAGMLPTSSAQMSALRELEAEHEAYLAVGADLGKAVLAAARIVAQSLPQTQSGPAQAIYQEWLSLDARFNEAMTQYDAHQKRSRKASGPALTPFGLIAPESIRIIDEPRDPTLPTTSLLKIILACLMGGIGLGVSLAAIAEQLDDRVYEGRELEGIAGAENVFRIPHIEGDRNLADEMRDRPLRRLKHLSVVSEG